MSVLILRCLASSITLVTFTQRYKKLSLSGDSRDYVLNAILSPGVLQSLILLYPQYIARITYQNAYEDTLQLSTLYDRNSDIFCQLLLLLHHHASFTHMLTTSVPRPESLFTEYHLTLCGGRYSAVGFGFFRSGFAAGALASCFTVRFESLGYHNAGV